MGCLLKEALKSLCGSNQWSYAVFWKIGCQNPKLLIWEESFCVTTPNSRLSSISQTGDVELPSEEWEGCKISPTNSTTPHHTTNGVYLLINRMMINNQVNIVGEGLIGRAAFTGKHQWIFSENYLIDAHPPEVLNEVRHQYSAGMQTVAVIPVLHHGVVQLGSSLAIEENLGFVNDVRSLISQLGRVPGPFFSDLYVMDESAQKIGIPIRFGASVSADLSGNLKVANSSSFISGSSKQRSNPSQASRLVGEFSDSVEKQVQQFPQTTASTFQTRNRTQSLVKPRDDHFQPELIPAMKPSFSLDSQLENKCTGAIVIPQNLDAWQKQEASIYNPGSGFNHRSGIGKSVVAYGSRRLIEQHLSSEGDLQKYANCNESAADSSIISQPITTGGLHSIVHKSHANIPLFGGTESNKSMDNHHGRNSVPSSFLNPNRPPGISFLSSHRFGFQSVDSSKTDAVSVSTLGNQVTASQMYSGGSHRFCQSRDINHTQIEEVPKKQELENDIFQALSSQLSGGDAHMSVIQHIAKHNSGNQSLMSGTAIFEDACVQPPPGDDLFDILGADFKKKLLNSDNSSFFSGRGVNKNTNIKDTLSSLYPLDKVADFNSISEGISDSSIFPANDSDHLLDAVVSGVPLAASQSSDDNVSCRTTVTKISSCVVPSNSASNQVCLSSQRPGEIIGFPKFLGKTGTIGSNSFRSGCSKDDVRNCSQSSSLYGSQISSWAEQCHSIKLDGSVSTAYSKKPDDISKSNRKRFKPGENPRPRPKDRQMIQDRVKELREIVPNGAKCSIDALLERTIKHMLFLQSVTKHADKLKQTGESKIINKEGGLLLKDNFEGGATWAFEVGSQSVICPIIVEDLNPPRQMLVEMLCEERGFFLEIADIIRGLGLTILKGVMEARNDKIWARFAVEANRDVTRMEIFISLVRLLEQTVKTSAVLDTNGIDTNNTVIHHSFHQPPCIPTSDRSVSLH